MKSLFSFKGIMKLIWGVATLVFLVGIFGTFATGDLNLRMAKEVLLFSYGIASILTVIFQVIYIVFYLFLIKHRNVDRGLKEEFLKLLYNWNGKGKKIWYSIFLIGGTTYLYKFLRLDNYFPVREKVVIWVASGLVFYLIMYFLYLIIAHYRKAFEGIMKVGEAVVLNRKEFALRTKKELFFGGKYDAIAFNRVSGRFEFLKITPCMEETQNSESSDIFKGCLEHYQKDFFLKNKMEFFEIKDIQIDYSNFTRTVSTKEFKSIQKQYHENETVEIKKIHIVLDNDIRLVFDDDYIIHHNIDTEDDEHYSFNSFYDKYKFKVKKKEAV